MIPAFGMVMLPQNPSTGNGHVPGWSCILSVGGWARTYADRGLHKPSICGLAIDFLAWPTVNARAVLALNVV